MTIKEFRIKWDGRPIRGSTQQALVEILDMITDLVSVIEDVENRDSTSRNAADITKL